MRATLMTALVATLLLAAPSAIDAAPRLGAPRPMRPGGEFFAPGVQVPAALSRMGAEPTLRILDSWVTSDFMRDEFSTETHWYEWERIQVVGTFASETARRVIATLTIANSEGRTVFTATRSGVPEAGAMTGVVFDVGPIPSGAYKVTMEFEQGSQVASQSSWMVVITDASAAEGE